MEGIDADKFIQSLEKEYANLKLVMEKEPVIDRAILLLCMATAVKCMDWSEPGKTLGACKETVRSVTEYAITVIDRWAPEGRFVFYNEDVSEQEWNDLFMESQKLAEDLLQAHIDAFGADTEENIMHAYNETLFCLTYMISAGCARCTDQNGAVGYAVKNMDKAFDFIEKNCRRVEV